MNSLLAQIVLGVAQGILEWIPISSSAHLELLARALQYDLSLDFTAALHFGTLMAVFAYFGQDITDMVRDVFSLKFNTPHGKLGIAVILASIPAGLFGYLLQGLIDSSSNSLLGMSFGFAITSMALFIGVYGRPKKKSDLSYTSAFFIGLAQVASLFRGVSRSGSTMSTGLIFGLDMKTAVKFSYLISIPIILGANLLSVGTRTLPSNYLLPSLIAFFVGIFAINLSFKYILNKAENLKWFAVYTLILALVLGAIALF